MKIRQPNRLSTPLRGWGGVIAAFGIYGAISWAYRNQPNEIIMLLGVLPILVSGWFFGILGGILSVPATYLLIFLLLTISGHGRWDAFLLHFQDTAPLVVFFRVIGMVTLGAVAGGLSERLHSLEKEIEKHESRVDFLLRKEASYKDFIENAQDLFCTHDFNGTILTINRVAASLLEYPIELLYTMRLSDFLLPENRHLFQDYLHALKTAGKAQGLLALRTRSGEERILAYRSTLLHEKNRPPIGRVIARDVTEEIRKERIRKAEIAFLEKLTNATRAALKAETFTSMLPILAEKIVEVFDAQHCFIAVWNEETQSLHPAAAFGADREKFLAEGFDEAQYTLAAQALREGETLFWDTSKKPTARSTCQDKSCFVLPLLADREKLGVALVEYDEPAQFTQNQIEQARRAAQQFSMTADKIWLLDKAHRRLKELNALHSLSLAIEEASDENALLARVTEILGKTLYPDHFDILMRDETKTRLVFHSAYKGMREPLTSIPLGKGVAGRVVRTGKPALLFDTAKDPDYFAAVQGMRSEICVPITLRGEVIGVINAESRPVNAFSREDERLLVAAAEQLAVAIDRLRSRASLQEWAARLERSNSLIRALTQIAAYMETATDPQKVMERMGTELKDLGLDTAVMLLDPTYQYFQVKYVSVDERVVSSIERLTHTTMSQYHIDINDFSSVLKRWEDSAATDSPKFLENALQAIFPHAPEKIVSRVLKVLGTKQTKVVRYFPLLAQEKFLGYLWLWGKDLRSEDLPALSLFATQAAITLENARLFREVERLAVTDELTNINNRRHFFKLAFSEFYRARRYARPLSVLMIDIDFFKKTNDQYGHAIGDIVLQEIARLCQTTLRDLDIIGRYGGEEFIVLLSETELDDAQAIAERLREKVQNAKISTPKGDLRVTVSIGVAGDNTEATNLLEMIESADAAMYEAKEAGRNLVKVAPTKTLIKHQGADFSQT